VAQQGPERRLKLTITALDALQPGEAWGRRFQRHWPGYRRWWLSQGEAPRPTYLECRNAIVEHMPELAPVYDALAELAGGSDLVARFLSCYSPPPYQAGCSQAVWPGENPLLVRNYDYSPDAFDALVMRTAWLGRRVLGISDCMIGLLDGLNEDGLAVSLTFGGRRDVGPGFGIPLVLRYVLETCVTTAQAVEALQRIPSHMAYNVTVLDRTGAVNTVMLSPGRRPVVTQALAATNHQDQPHSLEQQGVRSSLYREAYLLQQLEKRAGPAAAFVSAFLRPPLYSLNFEHGFGTLYTAVYRPDQASLELRWPGICWRQSLDHFSEGTRDIELDPRPGQ
jgi:predicted choloylglycine hydrolase